LEHQGSRAAGPVNSDMLLHGEQVAVDVISRVGRGNHSLVKVRVIGSGSVSWVDAVFKWGGGENYKG
jgi:hypothetical protein